MVKYCIVDDTDLSRLIDSEVNRCKDLIVRVLDDELVSIVLIGGFGRGEGGVYQQSNGAWIPKNNYDFLIVVSASGVRRLNKLKVKMNEVKDTLNKDLSINFEYSVRSEKSIRHAKAHLIYFDIYISSKVLYGRAIQEILPKSVTSRLAKSEGMQLIRNRMVLLLMRELNTQPDHHRKELMSMTWLAKVIIGFGDALMISKNSYTTKYVDKVACIQGLHISDVFLNPEDASMFKTLFCEASFFRLRGDRVVEMEGVDRTLRLLKQVHLWVIRDSVADKKMSWSNFFELNFMPRNTLKSIVKSVKHNFKAFGFKKICAASFTRPCLVLQSPSLRLIQAMCMMIYPIDTGISVLPHKYLLMDKNSTELDLKKECCRVFQALYA